MFDHFARFLVGLVGGAFLLIPATVMLLGERSLTDNLVTLVVSIIVLSSFVSLAARPMNTETLTAVAAYTGVLIAFVSNYRPVLT